MIRTALLLGTLALAALPRHARAADFEVHNAGDLADLCAGKQATASARDGAIDFCHGYAQGVVNLQQDHEKRPFCIPNPAPTRSATLAEFTTWVRASPDRQAQTAPKALIAFFKERFPCKS